MYIVLWTECRFSKDTPLPTPTHKYNTWANDRKNLVITPQSREVQKGRRGGHSGKMLEGAQKEDWEEEQKVCAGALSQQLSTRCSVCMWFDIYL